MSILAFGLRAFGPLSSSYMWSIALLCYSIIRGLPKTCQQGWNWRPCQTDGSELLGLCVTNSPKKGETTKEKCMWSSTETYHLIPDHLYHNIYHIFFEHSIEYSKTIQSINKFFLLYSRMSCYLSIISSFLKNQQKSKSVVLKVGPWTSGGLRSSSHRSAKQSSKRRSTYNK